MTYIYKKIRNFKPMPYVRYSDNGVRMIKHDLSFLDDSIITDFDSNRKAIWNGFYVLLSEFRNSNKNFLYDDNSPIIIEKQEDYLSIYLKSKNRRSRIDVEDACMGALAIMHMCKLV